MAKDDGLGLLLLIAAINIGGAPMGAPTAEAPPITEEAPIIHEEMITTITTITTITEEAPPIQETIAGKLFEEHMITPTEYMAETYPKTLEWTEIPYVPPTIAGELFLEAIAVVPIIQAPQMTEEAPTIAGKLFLEAIAETYPIVEVAPQPEPEPIIEEAPQMPEYLYTHLRFI